MPLKIASPGVTMRPYVFHFTLAISLLLPACVDMSALPVSAGFGPKPTLPAPQKSLIPTVNIAPAIGWPSGTQPVAVAGARVSAFASGLDHPRWLHVLPNGDVLVADDVGNVIWRVAAR